MKVVVNFNSAKKNAESNKIADEEKTAAETKSTPATKTTVATKPSPAAKTTTEIKATSAVKNTATVKTTSDSKAASTGGNYHIVADGETLYHISVVYHVTVDQLKEWNHLTSNTVRVGQKLVVGR